MDLRNIYGGKRILVTGATGLIGSSLVRRLLGFTGAEVVVCGRSMGKLQSVFAGSPSAGTLAFLEHDICRPIPKKVGRFDYIFHAASPISGSVIRSEPVSVIAANIRGAENCLECLRTQENGGSGTGVMVLFSSATVYGEAGSQERICAEEDTSGGERLSSPTAPYSESKRMVEVLASAYAREFGIGVRTVRFGYVYGSCPVLPATAFYEFIRKAVAGEDLVFRGSGFGRRDNIHVDDAINGMLAVCERGESAVPYNVSSNGDLGNYAAIDEMAEAIAAAAAEHGISCAVKLGGDGERAGGIRLDNTRAKSLGWSVEVPLAAGVKKVFDFEFRRARK